MSLLLYLQKKYHFSIYPARIQFFDFFSRGLEWHFFKKNKIPFCSGDTSYPLLILHIDEMLQKMVNQGGRVDTRIFYGAFCVAIKNIYADVFSNIGRFIYEKWIIFHPDIPCLPPNYFPECEVEFLRSIDFEIPIFDSEKLLFKHIPYPIDEALRQSIGDSEPVIFCLAVLQITLPNEENLLSEHELRWMMQLPHYAQIKSVCYYLLACYSQLWVKNFLKKIIFHPASCGFFYEIQTELSARSRHSSFQESKDLSLILPEFYFGYFDFLVDLEHLVTQYKFDQKCHKHLLKACSVFSNYFYLSLMKEVMADSLSFPFFVARFQLEEQLLRLRKEYVDFLSVESDLRHEETSCFNQVVALLDSLLSPNKMASSGFYKGRLFNNPEPPADDHDNHLADSLLNFDRVSL